MAREPKLVARRTFLEIELVGDAAEELEQAVAHPRCRSFSDSAVEYGCDNSDEEVRSGGSTTAAGEKEGGCSVACSSSEATSEGAEHSEDLAFETPAGDHAVAAASPVDARHESGEFRAPWVPQMAMQGAPILGLQNGTFMYCIAAAWVPVAPGAAALQGSGAAAAGPPNPEGTSGFARRGTELDITAAQMLAVARKAEAAARHARIKAEAPWRRREAPACAAPAPARAAPAAPGLLKTLAAAADSDPAKRPRQRHRKAAHRHDGGASSGGGAVGTEELTTVMLRNLPNDYTRDMLLALLDEEGFAGCYDFLYLPVDFQRWSGFGYAFVNLVSAAEAERAKAHFHGFNRWTVASQKVCEVCWGDPMQGLEAHIERYRNSPVMHEDVPEDVKPVFLRGGLRMPFPEPTKRIRAPRLKGSRAPADSHPVAAGAGSCGESGKDGAGIRTVSSAARTSTGCGVEPRDSADGNGSSAHRSFVAA